MRAAESGQRNGDAVLVLDDNALASGLAALRPRSTLVQLGLGGDIALPQNVVVGKEIEIKGSFRFHEEFTLAVDLINARRVDVRPLISDTFPLKDAVRAFELASDRARSMKVQLALQ